MRENQLNELQGVSIECTKPLAGSGITIKQQENGIEISGGGGGGGGGGGSVAGYYAITLNVCKSGTPATIIVLGKAQD